MKWPWVRRSRLESERASWKHDWLIASANLRAEVDMSHRQLDAVFDQVRETTAKTKAVERERDEANLRADIADAAMREAIRRLDAALLEFAED